MNQTLQFVESAPILDALSRLEKKFDVALEARDTEATYLPLAKLAKRYGLTRSPVRVYAAAAISAGKLRTIRPLMPDGRTHGNTLYHVADFEAYLQRNAEP